MVWWVEKGRREERALLFPAIHLKNMGLSELYFLIYKQRS